MNGQQYMVLAYGAGLGLLLSYVAALWIAARLARNVERRATAARLVVTAGAGGVL
jgi:hypothetical protein